MNIRCFIKRQLARVMVINSFCDCCGHGVKDYYAPDGVWKAVQGVCQYEILCYNCFSKRCWWLGFHGAWALVQLEDLTAKQRRGFNKLLGKVT